VGLAPDGHHADAGLEHLLLDTPCSATRRCAGHGLA
jgi:hypothetical protein